MKKLLWRVLKRGARMTSKVSDRIWLRSPDSVNWSIRISVSTAKVSQQQASRASILISAET